MAGRKLIVNADDFGASAGVNRGVVEAHVRGVVTSTSLMVKGAGATGAAALARLHPRLGVGLHWDLDSPVQGETIDSGDPGAVRDVGTQGAAQLHRAAHPAAEAAGSMRCHSVGVNTMSTPCSLP